MVTCCRLRLANVLTAKWNEIEPSATDTSPATVTAKEELLSFAGFCIPAPEGPAMAIVQSRHAILMTLNGCETVLSCIRLC